jgi:sulfate-transporting ATPase
MVAALIADFRSFPRAVGGGLMIGVMETLGGRYVHQPGFGTAVPFLIMIAVLIGRGRSLPERGHILQRLPRVGTGRAHPVATLVAVLASVWLLGDVLTTRWVDGITISLGFAIVCLSIVVVTGYAGQISLAQYSLAGIGAFIAGRLVATQGFPLPLAALIGVIGAIPVGMLVGVPALRSRGINLAVATLGLGVVINAVIFENYGYTGGLGGTAVGSPKLFGWSIDATVHPQRYAIVSLLAFTACGLLVLNVRRGSIGRRLIAVRENERAAASLGINIAGAKLFAFGFSAAIAALGGILIAFRFSSILYSDFAPIQSVFVVATSVLGGLGLILGALVGALAVAPGGAGTVVGHYLGSIEKYIPLIGGIGLLIMLIVHPDGLAWDLGHAGRSLGRRLQAVARQLRLTSSEHEDDPLDLGDDSQGISRVRPATLKVEHLTVTFGGVRAVSNVSVTVPPGQVVGLIGPNGAGKTTFIDATTGFTRPSEGAITLEGERLEGTPPLKRSRSGLSRSFQSLELFEDMTVEDNLRAGCDALERPGYLRNLLWPRRSALTSGARAAVREFGLTSDLERFPRELPYGRRRLVAIARSVAVLPSVLLLDEPAGGLDEHERIELGRLVRRLADEWGIGVLIVEHDIDLIMGICDEINVLDFGMLIASGSPSEIREHPAVVAAYLGEAETSALPAPNLVGE